MREKGKERQKEIHKTPYINRSLLKKWNETKNTVFFKYRTPKC